MLAVLKASTGRLLVASEALRRDALPLDCLAVAARQARTLCAAAWRDRLVIVELSEQASAVSVLATYGSSALPPALVG